MRNADIADAFDELAERLALVDEKPYRLMAYRRAAKLFRSLHDSAALLSEEGRLTELEGVGPAIDEKVRSLVATGTFPALERARADVPDALLELTRVSGIGGKTARKVHEAIDGESMESLLQRAVDGSLADTPGITAKTVSLLAEEAARRGAGEGPRGEHEGVPRGEDGQPMRGPWIRRDQAHDLLEVLAGALPDSLRDPVPVGAYARGSELLCDVRLVVGADDPPAAAAELADALGARGWELVGDAARPRTLHGIDAARIPSLRVVTPAGIPAVVAVASDEDRPLALHRMYGPSAWVVREPAPPSDASADVPPELRERVLAGALAREDVPDDLVTAADLRGELHAHSDWSDGKVPILGMARAARERGDEYFAVTDHSAPYAMVGGLGEERLLAQAEEVAAANQQLLRDHELDGAPPMRVLQGTECEILADGELGLPDSALARLDWVVASIHVGQRQDAAQLRERMLRVAANPLVDAIGHPMSRRVLTRPCTALDVGELVAMAQATGLVLEINANPDRLDLDSDNAARALAAGVRLTVNTDAHRTTTLAYREHGVAVARRAGARRCDVVNCLPAEELLAGRRRHGG